MRNSLVTDEILAAVAENIPEGCEIVITLRGTRYHPSGRRVKGGEIDVSYKASVPLTGVDYEADAEIPVNPPEEHVDFPRLPGLTENYARWFGRSEQRDEDGDPRSRDGSWELWYDDEDGVIACQVLAALEQLLEFLRDTSEARKAYNEHRRALYR